MKTQSIGFIGGGRVTRILLNSFINKNERFSKIIVTDTDNIVTGSLKKSFPEVIIGNLLLAASQDIVIISLHPPVIMDTLETGKDLFNTGAVVISLAPKITIGKISSKLPLIKNIARLIPNATSYINEGYNPVCFSPEFNPEDKIRVLSLLKLMGNTFEVKEEKLESYAIMSAMLPTYFWFQWKELMSIGAQIGLDENECSDSIRETIYASLNLMFKSDLSVDEVMDLIPVKPIAEHESQITGIYKAKLIPLFEKIKP